MAPLPKLISFLPAASGATALRRFRPEDLDRFRGYRADPELARYQGWAPMSPVEASAFVEEMAEIDALRIGGWVQLAIADAASDHLVGDLGLFLEPDGSAAEIGFTLCREAQGQGHATRAVAAAIALLGAASPAREVRAMTDARNLPSIRVLERASFTRSHVREAVFKGEPCREIVFVRALPEPVGPRSTRSAARNGEKNVE